MSTTTISVSPRCAHGPTTATTFAGTLKSEWIKLTTVRSTIWSLIILTVVTLGLAALMGSRRVEKPPTYEMVRELVIDSASNSITLTCLVVAVLGVLFSAGEYGTGSIRSTMTATPRRLPVLWAKTVVLGLSTFVFGFILSIASIAIVAGQHAARGLDNVSVDSVTLAAACAAAGYLALTAIFALAIGFIVRSVPAGISIVVGILFAIPVVASIIGESVTWVNDVAVYQFTRSGSSFYKMVPAHYPGALEPWAGGLIVAAWVAIATLIAATIVKTRDV